MKLGGDIKIGDDRYFFFDKKVANRLSGGHTQRDFLYKQ